MTHFSEQEQRKPDLAPSFEDGEIHRFPRRCPDVLPVGREEELLEGLAHSNEGHQVTRFEVGADLRHGGELPDCRSVPVSAGEYQNTRLAENVVWKGKEGDLGDNDSFLL